MDSISSISFPNEPLMSSLLSRWVKQQSNSKSTRKWWQKCSRNVQLMRGSFEEINTMYLWNRDFSHWLNFLSSWAIQNPPFHLPYFLYVLHLLSSAPRIVIFRRMILSFHSKTNALKGNFNVSCKTFKYTFRQSCFPFF